MAEYIDRWSIMRTAHILRPNDKELMSAISSIPAADVAPVRRGLWEWDTEDIYRCTFCGNKAHIKEVMGYPAWDYCPNCGARMDGAE